MAALATGLAGYHWVPSSFSLLPLCPTIALSLYFYCYQRCIHMHRQLHNTTQGVRLAQQPKNNNNNKLFNNIKKTPQNKFFFKKYSYLPYSWDKLCTIYICCQLSGACFINLYQLCADIKVQLIDIYVERKEFVRYLIIIFGLY